jgi:hypothetical protein
MATASAVIPKIPAALAIYAATTSSADVKDSNFFELPTLHY